MSDNLFVDVLRRARKNKELVCVYRNPTDLRHFTMGYVASVGEEDFAIQLVGRDGQPDGLEVGVVDDIIEIRTEARVTRQMNLLIENAGDAEAGVLPWKNSGRAGSCLESAFEQALKDRRVVRVQISTGDDDAWIDGLVAALTETHVQLDVLTRDGEPDGRSTLRLDDIAGMQMGTRDELRVALFHKHRTHLYL